MVDINAMTIQSFSNILMNSASENAVTAAFLENAFQGFNIEAFFDVLKTKALTMNKSSQAFTRDVIDILTWYVQRGPNIAKRNLSAKTTPGAMTKLQALIRDYALVPNSTAPESITIPRIATLFPEVVARIITLAKLKFTPVGGDFSTNDASLDYLPKCLHFPQAAGLIPKGAVTITNTKYNFNKYLGRFYNWACKFDSTINNPAQKKTPDASKVYNFIRIQQARVNDAMVGSILYALGVKGDILTDLDVGAIKSAQDKINSDNIALAASMTKA
jgi:hypothetical protein